jgi:hypothetical protein
MGGGEHSARGRLTKVRVGFASGKERSEAKDTVPFPFPSATMHEAPGHGEAAAVRAGLTRRQRPTREERGQGPTLPPGSTRARAGVHGGAGRRVREATWANASANGSARRCGRERQGSAFNSDKGRLGQESGRASMKAVAPANGLSQPGTKAGITSGGAEQQRVPPRLEGRGIHMGREAVVLTSVATGRSAGVGAEWWCSSSAGKKTRAAA